jgi:TPR repeat protein
VLAEMALGYCYETGTGVLQRKGEAAKLFRSAASRGSLDAFRALKRMHDELRPASAEFRISD